MKRFLHQGVVALASALSLVAAGAVAPTVTAAQSVQGTVVTADTVPVAGAVVSLIDSTNAAYTPTLTDEFGAFSIRAPRRGTWRLQAERVGFARVVSLPFELRAGETVERKVHLRDATARLATLQVRDRARCDVRPEVGSLVATLWDEARKALAATAAAGGTGVLLDLDRDEIEYDETFKRAHSATRSTTTGRAAQVFRSAPPSSLRSLGYVRIIDTTTVYFGPDARALLSNEFAATHCFTLAGDDPTSIRRIGLAFTPTDRPDGVIDIAGTVWLDRESYELDRIEFRYAPTLSAEHDDSTFGGRVHFARIPGGQVVVKQWSLRMPIFAPAEEKRTAPAGATSRMIIRSAAREVIAGLKLERGAARLPGERPLPLPEVVVGRGRPPAAPTCNADSLTKLGETWIAGTARDERERAAAGANLRFSWHRAETSGAQIAFRQEWAEVATDPQGRYAICGVPRDQPISIVARVRNATRLRARVRSASAGALTHDLRLGGRDIVVAANAPGAVRGVVTDRAGKPVPSAQVVLFEPSRRTTTNDAGEFAFDGLPPDTYDFWTRRLGFVPIIARFAITPGDTVSIALSVEQAPQALAAVTVEASAASLNLAGFELRAAAGTGSGQFIGEQVLTARAASPVENLLRTHSRARIEQSEATGTAKAYGRGAGLAADGGPDKCAMRIMIDGVLMPLESPLNVLPPVREIAGIEIYASAGAIPAQFAFAEGKCGLIAVWTRGG